MRERVGGKIGILTNYAPQPRMGMDRRAGAFGNEEVLLSGAWFDHQNIAGEHFRIGIDKVRTSGKVEPTLRIGISEPITFRRDWPATYFREARMKQSDAIEARNGIATMKPKWRSDKEGGGFGQVLTSTMRPRHPAP